MGLTVALIATLALAASAEVPQDAAGWRAQADALFAQGNFRGSLQAAERARLHASSRLLKLAVIVKE